MITEPGAHTRSSRPRMPTKAPAPLFFFKDNATIGFRHVDAGRGG